MIKEPYTATQARDWRDKHFLVDVAWEVRFKSLVDDLTRQLFYRPSTSSFFTHDTWGWDWGHVALRLHWFTNYGWPRLVKDRWCWHFTAGPVYLSGHV